MSRAQTICSSTSRSLLLLVYATVGLLSYAFVRLLREDCCCSGAAASRAHDRRRRRRPPPSRCPGPAGRSATAVVLDGCDLDIAAGEFVALLGRSGSGKSTLLRVLAGLDGEVDRRVLVRAGARRLPGPPAAAVAAGAGQRRCSALPGPRTAADASTRPWRRSGWPTTPGLAATLSGGEAQRVALARALVREPDLLLLDEPFGALDALTRLKMHGPVDELWRRHRPPSLLVTHDVDEALLLADRVVVLWRVGDWSLDELVDLPRPALPRGRLLDAAPGGPAGRAGRRRAGRRRGERPVIRARPGDRRPDGGRARPRWRTGRRLGGDQAATAAPGSCSPTRAARHQRRRRGRGQQPLVRRPRDRRREASMRTRRGRGAGSPSPAGWARVPRPTTASDGPRRFGYPFPRDEDGRRAAHQPAGTRVHAPDAAPGPARWGPRPRPLPRPGAADRRRRRRVAAPPGCAPGRLRPWQVVAGAVVWPPAAARSCPARSASTSTPATGSSWPPNSGRTCPAWSSPARTRCPRGAGNHTKGSMLQFATLLRRGRRAAGPAVRRRRVRRRPAGRGPGPRGVRPARPGARGASAGDARRRSPTTSCRSTRRHRPVHPAYPIRLVYEGTVRGTGGLRR